MKVKDLTLDMKATYGELRFFGLERENMIYDNSLRQWTNQMDSRVYNVLSMDKAEMLEVTIPLSARNDVITLDKNAVIELASPRLTVTGSVVQKGARNSVELKPVLTTDNIVLSNAVKNSPKQG